MSFVMQKVKNEGTTSPYVARLWSGIAELRDETLTSPTAISQFDERYAPVLKALDKARDSARIVRQLLKNHRRATAKAGVVELLPNGGISIHHSINEPLAQAFDSFTLFGQRAIRLTQNLLREVAGLDIGFLFKTDSQFASARPKLEGSRPELAAYILSSRDQLTAKLVSLRNDIEHGGWSLPSLQYRNQAGQVEIGEPMIDSLPFSAYVDNASNRSIRFVEDVTAYALQTRLGNPRAIVEIPPGQRPPIHPKRFSLGLQGDERTWRIAWADDPVDLLWNGQ